MMIHHLFSVPFYRTEIGRHGIDLSLYDPNRNAWDGEMNTTFSTDRMVLKNLPDLENVITSQVAEFVKILTGLDTHSIHIDSSWINFGETGDQQYEHDHIGGSDISGVYYIHVPPDSGDIKFKNPITQFRYIEGHCVNAIPFWHRNSFTRPDTSYIPSDGELILFPSFLRHRVMPNRSEETRITLAFNATVNHAEETGT